MPIIFALDHSDTRSGMGRGCAWLIAVLLSVVLWSAALPGYALTVQEIPNPRPQGGWVSDSADLISSPMEQRLNGVLTRLEDQTRVEMAVVTLPSIDPGSTAKAFATELFNTWGIGKADENNGVLLLVSAGDRRIEIETGLGMGDRLPPDRLHQIIQQHMRPAFRQEDFDGGIWAGVTAITLELGASHPNAPLITASLRRIYAGIGLVGLALLGVGYGWVYAVRQRPCYLPPTGQYTYPPSYSFLDPRDISLQRLTTATQHRPTWPALPFWVSGVGIVLVSAAIAFWGLAIVDHPYDANHESWLYLATVLGVVLGVALLYLLEYVLHGKPLTLGDLGLFLLGGLTGFGLIISPLALILGLWRWVAGPPAPQVQVALLVPLYVGLLSAGIAAFFIKEKIGTGRTPPQYLCQTCQQPIQLAKAHTLLPYQPNRRYHGWYCPQCHPTLSADGLFLITEEKQPSYSSGSSHSSSGTDFSSTTSASSSTTDTSSWEPSGSSGSSDFGGGSSDGGGAGDSW